MNEFKTSCNVIDLSSDIDGANDGTLEDMPMFGYWEGGISVETNNVQVSLGRMLTRINLVINNQSGSTQNVTSMSNVSKKVYVFPDVDHAALPDSAYMTVDIKRVVASGKTAELYFYMAPNFTAGEDNATKLNIGSETVILSNGAPSDSPRDFNLYHNSNYTFTINVK